MRISFRGAVISGILVVVMLSWVGMFLPLTIATQEVHNAGCKVCKDQLDAQQTAIRCLSGRTSQDYLSKMLSDLQVKVRQYVWSPSNDAVDALLGHMESWHSFEPAFDGLSDASNRSSVAFFSYTLLMNQWGKINATMPVLSNGLVVVPDPHSDRLYAALGTGEAAGVRFNVIGDNSSSGRTQKREVFYLDSGGDNLTARAVDDVDASPVGPIHDATVGYDPNTRGYYKVQQKIRETPGQGIELKRAWSELYMLIDGNLGLSWTAPIAYCGNYSCFEGVVASDIVLAYISMVLDATWKKLLADSSSAISRNNSSIFIVNQFSEYYPKQSGLLVGASGEPLAHNVDQINLTNATACPYPMVTSTASALLDKYNQNWNHDDLKQHGTIRLLSGSRTYKPCNESKVEPECLRVVWEPVNLDPHNDSIWLVVVVLPLYSLKFASNAEDIMKHANDSLVNITHKSDHHMQDITMSGLIVLIVILIISALIGLFVGCLVTRPLQRLRDKLLKMADLDFQDEGGYLARLQRGETSQIRDVAKLQRAFISLKNGTEAFSRFVPETVVRNIVQGDQRATKLNVSRRYVTIMFSKIHDASRLSELLPQPKDFLHVLKRYFSVMTRVVEIYDGVVGEIMTEPPGLLVFWNTPLTVQDHEAKACAAALAQQHAMRMLNEEFAQDGLPQLGIHIGIHTGFVRSGNLGCEKKMKFGCLGDPMNLASRLSGLCKMYGIGVLVSAATHSPLPEPFLSRKLDLVKVKGRLEPTEIYEVIGCEQGRAPSCRGSHGDLESGVPEEEKADLEEAPPAVAAGGSDIKVQLTSTTDAVAMALALSHSEAERAGAVRTRSSGQRPSWQLFQGRLPAERAPGGCPSAGAWPLVSSSSCACPSVTLAQRNYAARYEAALDAFQRGCFGEARGITMELLKERPQDFAAAALSKRAGQHLGPDGCVVGLTEEELRNWTGVLNMVGN